MAVDEGLITPVIRDANLKGAVEERVIVEDGEAVIAPRMKITMSCDHRVIDGAMGARFLQTSTGFLEEPAMLLA